MFAKNPVWAFINLADEVSDPQSLDSHIHLASGRMNASYAFRALPAVCAASAQASAWGTSWTLNPKPQTLNPKP